MAGLVPAERLDSASVAAAAVRAALRGAPFSITSRYPPIYKHVAHLLHLLPLRMRNAAVAWGASWSVGTTFESLREMDGDLLARHLLKGWPKRRFSGIHMGSPAGGAASWAAVEWSPFLPTSVLFSLQCRKDPDDLDAVISRAKAWGKELAPRLPDWELVWHHDPIHDRLLVRNVLHLRCRLKRLPASWSDWIRSHIPPSSPALLHHLPGYMWPRWGLGEAGFLQVGGLGGIDPEDFPQPLGLDGPFPAEESEWGVESTLVKDVSEALPRVGVNLSVHTYPTVESLSMASFRRQVMELRLRGEVREGVAAVDSFTHQDPGSWHRLGIPVLWMPFNTTDALSWIPSFLEEHSIRKVFWTAVPSYDNASDTVTFEDLEALFKPFGGIPVGPNPSQWPSDPLCPLRYDSRDLSSLVGGG